MKLLVFEWNAYMKEDLELVLIKERVPFGRFSYQFDNLIEDDYFLRHFEQVLRDGGYDTVISMNFWPLIAEVCHKINVSYIAWVYDCPIAVDVSATLGFATNYVFLFDRVQYEQYITEGYDTVYHLPLAVNLERLDSILVSREEERKYQTDISFVGNMYQSDYGVLKSELNEYERGYLEGVIESQSKIYGCYYVNDILDDNMLHNIKMKMEKNDKISYTEDDLFRRWVLKILSREITRRERLLLISVLSSRYDFKLYSTRQEPLLPKAKFCGTVDSFYHMPKVFKMSRINLNISYKQITVGMPLRVLDIMGAGGFLLSNYQEELATNFRPDVDCVIYESMEDAVQKAGYYLLHEDKRKEIAHNGHEAMKRFTFQCQLKKIFDIVQKGR